MKCLKRRDYLFRSGKDLSTGAVLGIVVSYLNNGDVVLGSFYKVEYSSGEIGVVGMGKGMKSSCLGKLLEKI